MLDSLEAVLEGLQSRRLFLGLLGLQPTPEGLLLGLPRQEHEDDEAEDEQDDQAADGAQRDVQAVVRCGGGRRCNSGLSGWILNVPSTATSGTR